MSNDEPEKKHHDDDGLTVESRLGSMRLPEKLVDSIAPHTKWIVFAIAVVIVFVGICYGISMIWTLKP
jgi:hypothetical protein